ncbi:DUF1850 domain-containing protein [uncultured Devosia sp.]|uniref:DUF1850 domain-containing protein n=1 Tax=uncultured Devosia sp. TaxID=211434 RepID=UPI00261248F2|nr:DUF1850 domain-containing protein [uncultured Devosia sp.]
MSLCIAASGKLIALAATAFSLNWTHSVEKTIWSESWIAEGGALRVVEASVEGSGAGIGLPDNAVLRDGRWVYSPQLAPVETIILAASGATVSPWTLCTPAACLDLGGESAEPIHIWASERCETE